MKSDSLTQETLYNNSYSQYNYYTNNYFLVLMNFCLLYKHLTNLVQKDFRTVDTKDPIRLKLVGFLLSI